MAGRLRKFLSLPPGRQHLLLRAFRQLHAARRALGRAAIRDLLPGLGPDDGAGQALVSAAQRERAQAIGWAVRTAARHTPWESACLVQVLAARSMLRAEGIPGVVFIGAGAGDAARAEPFGAHAWLTCGEAFVTGEAGHERYAVIGVHRW